MSEHSGNWYPVGGVQWDASGNPFQATSDGMKSYIPPIAAAQYRDDPRMLAWALSKGAHIDFGAPDANGNPTTSNIQTGAPEGGFAGNYHWNGEQGGYEKDNFFDSSLGSLVLGGSAVAAPFAASALMGAPAGAGGGASAALGPSTAGNMAATTTAMSGGGVPASLASTSGGSGGMGVLSKLFGGSGGSGGAGGGGGIMKSLDPTTLLLGALSLFGGPQQNVRESFTNPGSITDPKQALYQALQGTYRMGAGLEQKKPVQMRSSYVPPPPVAVNVPGVPFQIGGGLGRDPALGNPDLLTSHGLDGVLDFGPFQGIAQRTQEGKVK